MLTGSTSVAVTAHDTLQFYWQESSYSIAENYSLVDWYLYLIADGYGRISSNPLRDWAVTVNGEKASGSVNVSISNNTTKTLASGQTKIYHNADGSKEFSYSFSQDFQITFSNKWVGNISGSDTGTLTTLPRKAEITFAPNFNDEENPTITYSNPAGNAVEKLEVCISLGADGNWGANIPYKDDISKTGTSYTFKLNEAERNILRAATKGSNSRQVYFIISTTIGGVEETHSRQSTFSVINAQPTLSPVVYATDDLTKELTGDTDGNTLILGCSDVYVGYGQKAYKEAYIDKYYCRNGSQRLDGVSYGNLNNVGSGEFVFSVVDSRSNTATETLNKNSIAYIKLSGSLAAKIELDGETTAKITLDVKGSYWKGNFGAVENVLGVYIQYREKGGEWSSLQGLNYTLDSSKNTYTASGAITGLHYEKAYEVQAVLFDKVYQSGTFSNIATLKLFPVFDWSETDFNFNVPVHAVGGRIYSAHILADGSTSGVVNLSDTLSNYEYVEIFFADNNGVQGGYTKIHGLDGTVKVCLSIIEAASKETTYIRRTAYTLSGKTITPNTTTAGYHQLANTTLIPSNNSTNYIYITRVVGYK